MREDSFLKRAKHACIEMEKNNHSIQIINLNNVEKNENNKVITKAMSRNISWSITSDLTIF